MSKPLISRTQRVGDILYLSGMTAQGEDTKTQARNTLERIKATLEEHGLTMKNVVKATVYLTDISERPTEFNPIWREYFPDNPPTRTCVQVGLAPPTTVEVTVVAKYD